MPEIETETRLREKNQLTLPEAIARRLGAQPGDRFVWIMEEGEPDTIYLRRLRRSYAGIAAGVYGTPEEIKEYLEQERQAWDE